MKVELGNFVCNFGSTTFLENFVERFWNPIMAKPSIPRNWGETYEFVLIDLKTELIEGDVFFSAKVVRRQNLKSYQKLDKATGTLVPTDDQMQSDPSSIFLLRLRDHRAILIRETSSRAPKMIDIERMVKKILDNDFREKKKKFVEHGFKNQGKIRSKILRNKLIQEFHSTFPCHNFRITLLPSGDEVNKEIDKAARILGLTVKLLVVNNEIPPNFSSKLMAAVVETRKSSGSEKTTTARIELSDKDKGLSKSIVKDVIGDSVKYSGNSQFVAKCERNDGERFEIKNDSVKFSIDLQFENQPSANQLKIEAVRKFNDLIRNGLIRVGETDADLDLINNILISTKN